MSFLDSVKAKIGNESYSRIEDIAERDVASAMGMSLRDKYQQEQFYHPRFLVEGLLTECENFERAGLKILPVDIARALFSCQLLRAVQTEYEYRHRGSSILFDDYASAERWSDRSEAVGVLVDRHLTRLEGGLRQRTILTSISSFNPGKDGEMQAQSFFDALFATLGMPFVCFIDGEHLIEQHRRFEPGLRSYDRSSASEFFCAPSVGYAVSGSKTYCIWHASMWLRTFLNMLRIAGYLHPGQIAFGGEDVTMTAPTLPVVLGTHSMGCYSWNEDKKESWAKIPDGCLFLSFGYRGLSKMWLDGRSFPGIKKFIIDHKKICDSLKRPWSAGNMNVIAPALDILSSATQIPDVGTKILLVYCCLEHLFVPKNANTENKKYIIGGMNALGPNLIPRFGSLYDLRCDYAHKGFVLKNDETMTIIANSIRNVMTLLIAKLSVS